MAPAPGNESSDWLAPPRLATSLPRVPPLSNAPAQNPAGGPKSAKSLLLGGGSRICGQLESPRNALSGWALLGRRKRRCSPLGSAFFSMSVFRFRAALQLGPQVCICQKEFPFLYLPLCVSSCLRSLFGISHFFAGFRFQCPLVGPRGLGPSPILGRRRRPRATPARAGPPGTTLPSGLSGRRRGCGQVTESPDLR